MKVKEDDLGLNPRQKAMQRSLSIGSIRLVWLAFFSIALLLIWAALAQIDVVVRGQGQVVPSQRIQLIQNLEGGILQEIFVKEGEIVDQNQALARIDNTSAGAQYREALFRSLEHMATIARLKALIEGTNPDYPKEVLEYPELVARHNNIFTAMHEEDQAELDVLILQAEAETKRSEELKAKKIDVQKSLELATKQRDLAATAFKRGAFPEIDFLGLEQNVQDLKAEIVSLEHSIPRIELEVQEMHKKIDGFHAKADLRYNEEIGEEEAALVSLQELLKAGSDKVLRTELKSPLRGTVKRIYKTTLGGVLQPAETLMDIVPLDDSLIIEARFSPADIAFLSPGLPAIVRFSAYDFSVYGSMNATVDTISADTLQDSSTGMIFYIVKLKTADTVFHSQGRDLPILAGMQAEIDIVTGKKSILDYLTKPLLKVKNRAFTEQ